MKSWSSWPDPSRSYRWIFSWHLGGSGLKRSPQCILVPDPPKLFITCGVLEIGWLFFSGSERGVWDDEEGGGGGQVFINKHSTYRQLWVFLRIQGVPMRETVNGRTQGVSIYIFMYCVLWLKCFHTKRKGTYFVWNQDQGLQKFQSNLIFCCQICISCVIVDHQSSVKKSAGS